MTASWDYGDLFDFDESADPSNSHYFSNNAYPSNGNDYTSHANLNNHDDLHDIIGTNTSGANESNLSGENGGQVSDSQERHQEQDMLPVSGISPSDLMDNNYSGDLGWDDFEDPVFSSEENYNLQQDDVYFNDTAPNALSSTEEEHFDNQNHSTLISSLQTHLQQSLLAETPLYQASPLSGSSGISRPSLENHQTAYPERAADQIEEANDFENDLGHDVDDDIDDGREDVMGFKAEATPFEETNRPKKRKRVIKNETPQQQNDKKQAMLEKNRHAASKCRGNKKIWVRDLEEEAEKQFADLQRNKAELASVYEEIQQLLHKTKTIVACPRNDHDVTCPDKDPNISTQQVLQQCRPYHEEAHQAALRRAVEIQEDHTAFMEEYVAQKEKAHEQAKPSKNRDKKSSNTSDEAPLLGMDARVHKTKEMLVRSAFINEYIRVNQLVGNEVDDKKGSSMKPESEPSVAGDKALVRLKPGESAASSPGCQEAEKAYQAYQAKKAEVFEAQQAYYSQGSHLNHQGQNAQARQAQSFQQAQQTHMIQQAQSDQAHQTHSLKQAHSDHARQASQVRQSHQAQQPQILQSQQIRRDGPSQPYASQQGAQQQQYPTMYTPPAPHTETGQPPLSFSRYGENCPSPVRNYGQPQPYLGRRNSIGVYAPEPVQMARLNSTGSMHSMQSLRDIYNTPSMQEHYVSNLGMLQGRPTSVSGSHSSQASQNMSRTGSAESPNMMHNMQRNNSGYSSPYSTPNSGYSQHASFGDSGMSVGWSPSNGFSPASSHSAAYGRSAISAPTPESILRRSSGSNFDQAANMQRQLSNQSGNGTYRPISVFAQQSSFSMAPQTARATGPTDLMDPATYLNMTLQQGRPQ